MTCGDASINSGEEEELISELIQTGYGSIQVDVHHLTSLGITLKLHGLSFGCDNLKLLLAGFVNSNPMDTIFDSVLTDNAAIKSIEVRSGRGSNGRHPAVTWPRCLSWPVAVAPLPPMACGPVASRCPVATLPFSILPQSDAKASRVS